jgi:hypothetical protein
MNCVKDGMRIKGMNMEAMSHRMRMEEENTLSRPHLVGYGVDDDDDYDTSIFVFVNDVSEVESILTQIYSLVWCPGQNKRIVFLLLSFSSMDVVKGD